MIPLYGRIIVKFRKDKLKQVLLVQLMLFISVASHLQGRKCFLVTIYCWDFNLCSVFSLESLVFHITGQWGWKSKKGELVDSSENVQVLPGSGTESQDYAEQTEKIYWESQVSYYILLLITLDFNSKLKFSLSVIMCSTIVTI